MKRIAKIVLWMVVGLYIPIVITLTVIKRQNALIRSVSVSVADSASLQFVSPGEIKNYLNRKIKNLVGTPTSKINLEEIESLVNKFPAVAHTDAYITLLGDLRIVVKQRKAVLRVFANGSSYLLDEEGAKIPLRGSYSKRLMVVGGHLDKLKDKTDLVMVDKFISNDSFWKAQIEQIYVDNDGDILLVPRVGNHVINLGDANNLDYKFRNLLALYKEGLHPKEWNSYKVISLKYKGQVICSKI